MLATMVMIHEKYGSAEDYVRTVCGITAEEIERIRQVMIVSEDRTEDEDARKAAL